MEFFVKFWLVVEKQVIKAIMEFFKMDKLLREVNYTITAFVQKNANPNSYQIIVQHLIVILSTNILSRLLPIKLVPSCFP